MSYFVSHRSITNDRKVLLIATGCSWAAGCGSIKPAAEIVTDEECRTRFKNSYPSILAEMLNADVINVAKPGSSLDYAVESILMILPEIEKIRHNYDNVYLHVGLTDANRFSDIPNDTCEMTDFQPGWECTYTNDDIKNFIKWRTIAVESQMRSVYTELRTMLEIQTISKAHNLDCYMSQAFGRSSWCDDFSVDVEQRFGYLLSQIDTTRIMNKHDRPEYCPSFQAYLQTKGALEHNDVLTYISDCYHPTQQGHQLIAELIYEHISESQH